MEWADYILIAGTSVPLGVLAYDLGFKIVNELFASTLFRNEIESQEELVNIIDAEAKKLGLNPSLIDTTYSEEETGVRKIGDRYKLNIGTGSSITTQIIRHELYHIKKDCDRFEGRGIPVLASVLYVEPRAILYGCFSLKL